MLHKIIKKIIFNSISICTFNCFNCSTKRFPGYDAASKEYKADVHRDRILGKHVAEYMRSLQEEDEQVFKRQFGRYEAAGITPDGV